MVRPLVDCFAVGCGTGSATFGGGRGFVFRVGIIWGRASSSCVFVVSVARLRNKSDNCTLCLSKSHCRSGKCSSRTYSWLQPGRMLTDVLSRINSTGSASFRCCTLRTSRVLVPEWNTSKHVSDILRVIRNPGFQSGSCLAQLRCMTCTRSPTSRDGCTAVGHFALRSHARIVLRRAIPKANCICATSNRPCLGFLKSRVSVGRRVSMA